MVGIEFEVAAHGLEVLGFQRLLQGLLVCQIALHIAHRRIHHQRRVVALRGVQRRQAAVLFLEIGDETLVLGIVHVVRPVRGVEHADHRRADCLDYILVS